MIKERFEQKFIPEPMSGCWLWEAAVNEHGYGSVYHGGGSMLAHRAAYEIYVGPIPVGAQVCHTCDMPGCVNPEHLFLGTHADNMRDKAKKGRAHRLKGESHGRAKLTEADVLAIRVDERSKRAIGRHYGVSATTISWIKDGRGWTHI